MTNIQLDALDRFKSWQWWGNFDLREGDLDLQYLLEVFSDFFFNGALKNNVRAQWVQ